MAKDLYYIFDIITGCGRIKPDIMADFKSLSQKYPAWYQTFIKNLSSYFETPSSGGVLWVAEQRPPTAFPKLNEDQFKNFVFGAFREFIQNLSKKP